MNATAWDLWHSICTTDIKLTLRCKLSRMLIFCSWENSKLSSTCLPLHYPNTIMKCIPVSSAAETEDDAMLIVCLRLYLMMGQTDLGPSFCSLFSALPPNPFSAPLSHLKNYTPGWGSYKKLFRLIIDVLHFNQFYHGARLIKGCLPFPGVI